LLRTSPSLFAWPFLGSPKVMREFTEEELARYDGKDGAPAYIACDGKVYDVSNSFHWRNGKHHAMHSAGLDLTDSLEQAPHSADLLERVPVVGRLQES
jgi:predicted heme/steroid binding protein